jgi:hypothetical protein
VEDKGKGAKIGRIEGLAEYGIGFYLLMKGWDKAAHFHEYPFQVIFIFIAGLLVIAGASLRPWIEKKTPNFHGIVDILEGLVQIVVGSILLGEGNHFLPAFFAFVGLLSLSRGLTFLMAKEPKREAALKTYRLFAGIGMIVFGLSMAGLNAMTERKTVVYAATALLMVIGTIIIATWKTASRKKGRLLGKLAGLSKK